jgi:DNA-directed RNA polymerase subunit beta
MSTSINLLDPPDFDLAPKPKAKKYREFSDVDATRSNIYDQVLDAAKNVEPVKNQLHTLRLSNVGYVDPEKHSKAAQKHAILTGGTLGRRLRGTWELLDNATGEVLDQKHSVLATVPFLSERGTYVNSGNEYTLRNQQRLLPGLFVREKENGEIEAHANILPGKGVSHRYYLDPEKGVFHLRIQQAKLPLMPLVKAMGATPAQLRDAWGPDLYAANYPHDEAAAYRKIKEKVLKPADLEDPDEETHREKLVRKFAEMEMDPQVTQRTLGKPHKGLTLDAILDITKKLVAVSKGQANVDDRDALPYQRFLGPEDLFAERIARDHGQVRRGLLWKASMKGNLQGVPSSALKPQLEQALLGSGLGQALEEINPAEILDKLYSISRLGEGGIPSMEAVPDEARNVQPSHMGYMDPLRTPESFKVGVDLYMSRSSRKGQDGEIVSQFKDPRTGKTIWKSPQDISDLAVTFPAALTKYAGFKRVPAMKGGQLTWVKKRDVDLVLPNFEDAFSPLGNLVPMKSSVKGQRVAMASRMTTQALPMKNPEAPLVQSAIPGTNGQRSYEEEYAKHMGALRADRPGRVLSVSPDAIVVRHEDGSTQEHELYNHFPFNRKTYLHQSPLVAPGDEIKSGDLLARSNYTDHRGTTALGANLRTAYMSWGGLNYEDAVVISESAAKEKLASEHMYQHSVDVDERMKMGKRSYVGLFPAKYNRETLAKLDHRGVIQQGATVQYGEPLILAARERDHAANKVHKRKQAGYVDSSVVWEHHDPGVVTDVVDGKDGPVVLVKSTCGSQVGDKLSGRYGDKGVISAIIPDAQMPHDAEGNPFEMLLNPLGIISRTNPAQKHELWLGKIAAKTGQPIKVEDWSDRDTTEWVNDQLRAHNLKSTEDVIDPTRDRKIKNIATGSRFFMKLQHTAESKGQARGGGSYTTEDAPSKGGPSGSKRISMLDTNALLAHGATEVERDVGAIRGQRNEDYWLQFMQGHNPRTPKVPMVYEKFIHHLKASGINVVRHGTQTNVMALTDADVKHLAGERFLQSGETVRWDKDLKPIVGGLFDTAMTGGHNGTRWSAIKFHEPMPNPVMEEPIRRILNLTGKQFENVLTGDYKLGEYGTGPEAIAKALGKLNLDKEIALAETQRLSHTKNERDQAIRKLGFLKDAKRMGLHPGDWVLHQAPVLPPAFRPISMMQNNLPLVSDPNYLYKELMEANSNLRDMKKELGEEGVGQERLAVYHAFKAVTGLGDPISQKSRDKNVKGILASVFGSSPKFGTVQRKLISTTVDNVGRAVITPNPDYDMDSVGLPEDKAFDIYGKFIARRMKRNGMPLTEALQQIKDRTELARNTLLEEMEQRPVFINRAPVLHKFGIMAFRPQLVKGHTMQVSPLICKGFNADFDGDAMQFHVPTSPEAVREAYQRMLPSRSLLSPADFKTPVHMPTNEYLGGLFHASKAKSKKPKAIFHTAQEAREAYERGSIDIDTPVQIVGD